MRFHRIVIFAMAALVLAVLPVPTTQAQDGLVPFVPKPAGVLIQKGEFGGFGNVRLLVQLDAGGLQALEKHTGRRDFFVLGSADAPVVLRDDGQGADDVANDGLFAGVGTIADEALIERTNAERATHDRQPNAAVPSFDGRSIDGSKTLRPFDLEGFLSGRAVPLTPAVAALDASTQKSMTLALSREGARPVPNAFVTPGETVFQDKVLMIRDPSVVSDPLRTFNPCNGAGNPNGVWTFNHLMTEMANQPLTGIDPRDFTERWLDHWLSDQTINTFTAGERLSMQQLINDWRTASGGGQLDLTIAPFRLLAIVPRVDLRRSRNGGGGYGGAALGDFLDAGEARFVFGVVLPPGYSSAGYFPFGIVPHPSFPGCRVTRFSVIFEYGVPRCKCEGVRDWAQQWIALNGLAFPSAVYNQHLHRLTEQFVRRNSNPIKPNGSAINQIRTNELPLLPTVGPAQWQLREFQLTQFPFSFLEQTTVLRTADDGFNPSFIFDQWVLGPVLAAVSVNQPIPAVPLVFSGGPFQGSKSDVPTPAHFWDVTFAPSIAQNEARHAASLDACNGCHAGETGTPFVHIDPASTGPQADISGFLTGITLPDPKIAAVTRTFDDLDRRELDIQQVAQLACLALHPVSKAHVLDALAEVQILPPDLFAGLKPAPAAAQLSLAGDGMLSNIVTAGH